MNINQFGMNALLGDRGMSTGFSNTIACLYNPEAEDAIAPGQAVKLIDLGAADYNGIAPVVDVVASASDTGLWGVVVRSPQTSNYNAGEIVSVARNGTVVYLKATNALNRGTVVTFDFNNPGNVIAANSSSPVLGISLDKAISAGDLVRVEINTSLAVAS